jgi:hypothetical protein
MFYINDKVCTSLRAKNKWRKETCIFCCIPVSKCKKLIEQEDREYEEKVDKFDERNEMQSLAREAENVA